jgi:hypothetical protein
MTAKKLTVGAAVEAWCTKCKEDRAHAVETLKADGTAAKVRCNFCSGSHLYRPPKTGAEAKAKPEKKSESKAGGTKRRTKEPALTDSETSRAKPYQMDKEYAAGDVIDHRKFGFGRVIALKPGGKMEVHFDGGSKTLVCKDTGSLLLRRSSRAVARIMPEVAEEVEPDEAEAVPEAAADAAEE